MPEKEIRNHIRIATNELVAHKILHLKSQVESHVISFYPYRGIPPYSFDVEPSVLETLVSLAEASRAEDRQITAEHNISKSRQADHMFMGAEDLWEMYHKNRPADERLKAFKMGLDTNQLKALTALMYSGRDGIPYNDMRDYVEAWNHDQCCVALQKSPLPKYLRAGSEMLVKARS